MNIERKPELKHNEALLRQIIKRIDVNDCTGNSDLVMKIVKAYADEIIEPPITSEPPRQVSDEEIYRKLDTLIKLPNGTNKFYRNTYTITPAQVVELVRSILQKGGPE